MKQEKDVQTKETKIKNVLEETQIINDLIVTNDDEKEDILKILKDAETDNEFKFRDMNFVNENLLNLLNINQKNEKIINAMVRLLNEKKVVEEEINRLKIIDSSKGKKLEKIEKNLALIEVYKDKLINDYTSELKKAINEIKISIENTHSTIIKNNKELKLQAEKTLKPRFQLISFFTKSKKANDENNIIKKNIEEWLVNKKSEIDEFLDQAEKMQKEFNDFKEKTSEIKLPEIDKQIYQNLTNEKKEIINEKLLTNLDKSKINSRISELVIRKDKIDLEVKKLKEKYQLNEKEKWVSELKNATKNM